MNMEKAEKQLQLLEETLALAQQKQDLQDQLQHETGVENRTATATRIEALEQQISGNMKHLNALKM